MKKLLFLLFLLPFLTLRSQDIPKAPNPPRLVNDFAHVMTTDQVASLEQKLVAYDDGTSIQIAVVTVNTTGDYSIDDYALKILREWGVGNKKTNNGLVIVAAIQDRKVFIATGYGMEGSVPDVTAKAIIDNEITPNFKQSNFYRGFDLAADAIIDASKGEYKAPAGYDQRGAGHDDSGNIIGLVIFIIIIIVIIARRGGGGGGVANSSGFFPWIIASMLSNSGRGSGGWSGGDSGGGGGFGGFGGGGGGGGGAGGSW